MPNYTASNRIQISISVIYIQHETYIKKNYSGKIKTSKYLSTKSKIYINEDNNLDIKYYYSFTPILKKNIIIKKNNIKHLYIKKSTITIYYLESEYNLLEPTLNNLNEIIFTNTDGFNKFNNIKIAQYLFNTLKYICTT